MPDGAMGTGAQRLVAAIHAATRAGRPALAPFLTAGFPDREAFLTHARAVAGVADVMEIGVPFSDPMADGVTIQRASRVALENGVTLEWILQSLAEARLRAPTLLMSYLNPFLAFGPHRLARAAADSGVAGVIVPDLPYEECGPLRDALDGAGVALVQLVTPATPPDRMRVLCAESRGLVYAVTSLGTTGGRAAETGDALAYLDRVRAVSPWPVLAGFGIRTGAQLATIAAHADGVIVGSALLEAIERGDDPVHFLASLRDTPSQEMSR